MAGPGQRSRQIGRLFGRVIFAGVALWAMTLVGVAIGAAVLSRPALLPGPADAILCLGAGVSRGDPRLPDAASARRARACAALQGAGVAPVVIFTGAGLPGHSAADAMAASARTAGLAPEAALIEAQARSTVQNAAFSRPLLPQGARRVVLVSDAFHLPRAAVIFRLAGYGEIALHAAPGQGTAAEKRALGRWMLRESVAIWVNLGRGAAYVAGGALGIDRDRRIGWFD